MKQIVPFALFSFISAAPALAQMDHSAMPGMNMPAMTMPSDKSTKKEKAAPTKEGVASAKSAKRMPSKHDPAVHRMNMHGMQMPAATARSAEPEIPTTPPPPPPRYSAADLYFDPVAMAAAREEARRENGGGIAWRAFANLLEYQPGSAGGYRWDGEAWIGGDINRFVLKSEGEGSRRDGLETAEVQALYSRAVGVYTDLQFGVRYDFAPTPSRAYATVGFESLAPYWFEVTGALFLSNKGELMARLEGTHDLYLTQRFVLQPRVELNFAAQNSPEIKVGSGLSTAEVGLRLRYEIRREFAPYIGVSYSQKAGTTADYARAEGKDPGQVRFVTGLRVWF
ncbi:MAG: copper resistance protein B [Afipia sp.]|nr:copper resistance protein B [Afipia sp.]